jgi:hypothetical protein
MNVVQSTIIMREPMLYANSGGPMSRTRRERISSTLLGKDDGFIQCPLRIKLGLKFEDTHPVHCLEAILDAEGFRDPEELRSLYALPQEGLICRPLSVRAKRLRVVRASRRDVLEQALLLGLCTAQIFDPQRPVLWTETSLTRAVELFDPTGFYA